MGARSNYGKLLAAKAGREKASMRIFHTFRHFTNFTAHKRDNLIPYPMSVYIIDFLEVIDINNSKPMS